MAPPHAVFATPTTRLSIGDLANCTYRAEKCIAVVAEASALTANRSRNILLRTTARTNQETTDLLDDFWRRLGFNPTFEQELPPA
jgi:3-hydroxyacyl-CoA dehydrogenase